MSNEKSFVKSIFGFSISSWINIIFGFLYTILSTRLLIPEVYGMVSIFMSSSNTLMYVICLGLDASLIRFFNERPNSEKKQQYQTKTLFLITINLLVVFFIATVFLFDWFNMFMFGRLSWFLTIMVFVSAYAHLLLRFFNISYRMSFDIKKYTIQNVLIQSGTKIFTLVAALFKPTYETVILFQVCGIVFITLAYLILQRKDLFSSNLITKGERMFSGYSPVIKFALFSAPLYISMNLNTLLAQNIIKLTLGEVALGVYSSVAIFGTLFSAVSAGFSTFWSAYIYKNYNSEQKKIETMSDYILLIALLAICGFVFFKDLLYVFIGEKYKDGIYFFSIVLMTNVIDLLSQATYYGIDIVKKNYITAITNCCYVAVNAIFVYIGARQWGVIGAVICMMTAKIILFSINTLIAQQFYKSIQNNMRFVIGFMMIIAVSIIPSFHQGIVISDIMVLIIFIISVFLFKNQYGLAVVWVKSYVFKRNGV